MTTRARSRTSSKRTCVTSTSRSRRCAFGCVANVMPSVAEGCMSLLMRLVRSSNEHVVTESVVTTQLHQLLVIEKDLFRVGQSLAAIMTAGGMTNLSAPLRSCGCWVSSTTWGARQPARLRLSALRQELRGRVHGGVGSPSECGGEVGAPRATEVADLAAAAAVRDSFAQG